MVWVLVLIHCVQCVFVPRKRFKLIRASVVTLQKHFRKHIQRRRFVKQRKAALVLQRHRRGQVVRDRVRKLREEKTKREEEQKKKEEGEKKTPGEGEQEKVEVEGAAKKAKSPEEEAAGSVRFLEYSKNEKTL